MFKHNLNKVALAVAISAASLATSAPLHAQGTLEEIVITSTRTETNLQDTAVAVTALNTEQLENRGVADLRDVAKYTPGLEFMSTAGGGGSKGNAVIRGIGTDGIDSQASVGTYIDEVYFPSLFGNVLGLLDLDRIEVLRGPQGTLFGRNTIAGAIQYVTAAPGDELGGYVKATVGNLDRQTIEAAATLPVSDTFKLRIAAIDEEKGGYVEDRLNGIDRGAEDKTAFRIRGVWDVTDSLSVDLKAESIDLETNGTAAVIGDVNPFSQFPFLAANPGAYLPPTVAPFVPPVDVSGFNNSLVLPFDDAGEYALAGYDYPDFFEFEYDVVQANVSYEINDSLTLSSITASISSESFLSLDFDMTPIRVLQTQTDVDLDAFSQELKLTGTALDDRLTFTTGLFYYDEEAIGQNVGATGIGSLDPNFAVEGRGVIETKSVALYGQGTYDINDKTSVTLGLRYTDEEITSSITVVPNSELDFEFDDVSPHLGIQYQIDDDRMVYAKASKGFRAGGNTANVGLPNNGLSFEPEEAWTYELGARLTLLDGRLRFNPTLYRTDWSDLQSIIILFTPAPVATTQNVGDAEITGLEIESQFLVTDNLRLDFAAAIADAKYTEISASLPPAVLNLDSDLQGVPDLKYTIGLSYDTEIAGMPLNANIDYAWVDEKRSALQNPSVIDLDDYGLLGARLSLDVTEDFTLALWGQNLTDEAYAFGGTDFAKGATAGIQQLVVGRPRTVGIEARYDF
jgi:iron complex outermembrane receptor protein